MSIQYPLLRPPIHAQYITYTLQQFSGFNCEQTVYTANGHAIDVDWMQISFKLRLMCYFLFVLSVCVCASARLALIRMKKKIAAKNRLLRIFHLDYFENFPTTVLCLDEQIECSKHTCSIAYMYSFNLLYYIP